MFKQFKLKRVLTACMLILFFSEGNAQNSAANLLLGTYKSVVGDREYTYNKTPRLALQFNTNGTITDVSAGINRTGNITTLEGRHVFYMIGYFIFSEDYTSKYKAVEEIYLPDGVHTIRQFVCDPVAVPDLETFKSKIHGWNDGINNKIAYLSEIFLSIKTLNKPSKKIARSIAPEWLKVSRQMRYQDNTTEKDWAPYNKFVGTVYQNRGTTADQYQRLGLQTELIFDQPQPQPKTWVIPTWQTSTFISDSALYNNGKQWMQGGGNDRRFILTDQIHEKVFGDDPDIYGRLVNFYKGAYDQLTAHNPDITDKKQTGLYGTYNYDDFAGMISPEMLYQPKERYVESLTSHAHIVWDVWKRKWTSDTAEYYSRDLIQYRNANHMMYLWNDRHYLPYRLLYVNERVKIGTKTFRGKDQESNWIVFSWPCIQNMTQGTQNEYAGIEYASTGEIIPFPGGAITSVQNHEIPAPWDEWISMGFWSTLVSNGFVLWSSPRSRFGGDTTKLDWWTDQPVYWTPDGGSLEKYQSGKNGAPVTDVTGIRNRLWASPQDAALAGSDMVWNIRDRIKSLTHASYTSSKGKFIAIAGDQGLHLNGFGPVNKGQYVVKDAFDQQKGIALAGSGTAGKVVIYYNGFLSPHEFEDDVTISLEGGKKVKLGRVYGRQTVVKTL